MRAVWQRASAWQSAGRSFRAPGGAAERRRWLPLAASAGGAASAGALLLAEGPVQAKERSAKTRQEVYIWGRRQSIPGGAPGDVLWPKRISWFDQNEAGWAKISFGPSFGAALDKKGNVYLWGEGEEDFVGPIPADLLGEAKGQRFVDLQCSSSKIVALTARGQTFFLEGVVEAVNARSAAQPSDAPVALQGRTVPGLPRPGALSGLWGGGGVKQMSIGLEHAAFVTYRGELYCVGGNEWGQCGIAPPRQKGKMGALEDRSRFEIEWPVKVGNFPEEAGPIASVVVGGRHTIATDESGRVFSFGDDRRIQLGLGDTRTQGIDERNSYGVIRQDQLGGRDTKQEIKRVAQYRYYDPHMQSSPLETISPKVYNRPPYPPPSFIACGEDFTIAVHRDSPDWYTNEQETNILACCGENGDGQCGRGLQEQQQAWTSVRLPKRSRTEKVACGQSHCLALQTTGDLFAWGSSQQGQLGNGKRATKAKPIKIGLEPTVAAAKPKNISPPGQPPQFVATPAEFIPFPGKVVELSCGFRNNVVICEVPQET